MMEVKPKHITHCIFNRRILEYDTNTNMTNIVLQY